LIAADGTVYQSTTGSFSLSDPIFMSSYYNSLTKNIGYGAEGMIFVILSVLLLIIVLVIANRKTYHEVMSFIMTIQVLGLSRVK
jgi:hypothetical protein